MHHKIILLSFIFFLASCGIENSVSEHLLVSTTSSKEVVSAPYAETDNIPALAFIEHNEVYNAESVIPPQCYTKTDGSNNPCYACHQSYKYDEKRPNTMNDGGLQGEYEFSELGTTNHWKNLFVDRSELIKDLSDDYIKQWIKQDNYSAFVDRFSKDPNWKGEITPIKNLAEPSQAFDELGMAKDGSHWVAFNYKPFPSTFWPTNGSTGDAMIRLPQAFRQKNKLFSQDVYLANLGLLEMVFKETNEITIPPVSELIIGEDIDGDGKLSAETHRIKRRTHYVGDAAPQTLAHLLYPQDTEFLHTVRYIGVNDDGSIYNAQRMKEVRYMKKHSFKSKAELASEYYLEAKEKNFENLPQVHLLGDNGVNSNMGWTLNAYIEDVNGELRQQHGQELAFCSGCHKTIGATYDQTFSFPRKVEGAKGWGYINLKSQQDVPNKGENQGEFLTYFQRVGGGDEFRQNTEMLTRWFKKNGDVDLNKVAKAESVYDLITPSARRALDLNKAYLTIVKEQSYIFGRDATITAAKNVLQQIDEDQSPLAKEHRYQWDMRLDWRKQLENDVTMLVKP